MTIEIIYDGDEEKGFIHEQDGGYDAYVVLPKTPYHEEEEKFVGTFPDRLSAEEEIDHWWYLDERGYDGE